MPPSPVGRERGEITLSPPGRGRNNPAGSKTHLRAWVNSGGGVPLVLYIYAVTLFVSAFTLFLVQPLVGKMILPKLGGTPQVWNTCCVFFQMVLLAGYAYSHMV